MPYTRPTVPTKYATAIDRLRFVLGVVAIIAIVITFVFNHVENTAQDARITRIESPCLRYGANSRQCHQAFSEALRSLTPHQACYIAELRHEDPPFCRLLAAEEKRGRQSQQP